MSQKRWRCEAALPDGTRCNKRFSTWDGAGRPTCSKCKRAAGLPAETNLVNGRIGTEPKTRAQLDVLGMLRQLIVATRDDRVRLQGLALLAKSDICVTREESERDYERDLKAVINRLTLVQRQRLHELKGEMDAIRETARTQARTWDEDRQCYLDAEPIPNVYVPPVHEPDARSATEVVGEEDDFEEEV
jgi:hypothetical protein